MATRPSSGAATDHVSSIAVRGIRGLVLAGAVGAAVAGGSVLHAATAPSVVRGWVQPGAARPLASAVAARPAIPDVAWLVERGDGTWVHGRGADPSPAILPDDETGLAINGDLVASTRAASDGRSLVRLRDTETGAVVGEVEMPIWVSAGAWTRSGLVVTGYRDATMTADGGLVLVDETDLTARTLVEPGPFPGTLGTPVARGEVVVSPSGRLAASNACGMRLCETQVVDVTTGEVTRPLRSAEGFLRVVTDDTIVTTDGEGSWISARRVRDGAEAWRATDRMLLDPLAAADGSLIGVVGSHRAGWAVTRFDGGGRPTDLTTRTTADQPLPRIWRELSTPIRAVIGATAFDEAVTDLGRASVSVFPMQAADPATTVAPIGDDEEAVR